MHTHGPERNLACLYAGTVSAKPIVMRAEYAYCPNLTIIDTPGFILKVRPCLHAATITQRAWCPRFNLCMSSTSVCMLRPYTLSSAGSKQQGGRAGARRGGGEHAQ